MLWVGPGWEQFPWDGILSYKNEPFILWTYFMKCLLIGKN